MADPARVFISYSGKDSDLVDRLKTALAQAGTDVWLDHERLPPGTPDWRAAVLKGIEQATDVVYAASLDAAESIYVGHELAIARDEGKRILPFWVRGEKWSRCAPMGYFYAQYIDARDAAYAAGLVMLLATLGVASADPAVPTPTEPQRAPQPAQPVTQLAPHRQSDQPDTQLAPHRQTNQPATQSAQPAIPAERFPARLATLGFIPHARDGAEWVIPPVCLVPAGPFRLGSDKAHDPDAGNDELNRRVVTLRAFEIARFPVTVAEYACFLRATGRELPEGIMIKVAWQQQLQRLDHPVACVSWHDAFDYAAWLGERTGQPWRLPTEAEWEKAARCDPRDPLGASSERIYPWGDTFAQTRCNTQESDRRSTTPIGWYGPDDPDPLAGRQSGVSPCGAEELAGNVWEWLATAYAEDYSKSETAIRRDSPENYCLRGGSWGGFAKVARAARRYRYGSVSGVALFGFRLVRSSPDT